jgi:hypothetical protein
MLTQEQKKIAQVTVITNTAPVTTRVTAIQRVTQTIALARNQVIALVTALATAIQAVTQTRVLQRVPVTVREITTKVSNPGNNRSV